MLFRHLVRCAAAALCFSSVSLAAEAATSWLERTPPAGWNKPGASIPHPAAGYDLPARCRTAFRPPSSPEDKRVTAAGWHLVTSLQQFGTTSLIQAVSGLDGQCRWEGYQGFVFANGAFVGTLAPAAIDSRTDGALLSIDLFDALGLKAEFSRYTSADPMCCPSRTSQVMYSIVRGQGRAAVLVPISITTFPAAQR